MFKRAALLLAIVCWAWAGRSADSVVSTLSSGMIVIDTTFEDGSSVSNGLDVAYGNPGTGTCRVTANEELLIESGESGVLGWTPGQAGLYTLVWQSAECAMTTTVNAAALPTPPEPVVTQVATPLVTAAETFQGSRTKVSISCATEGARIYYTLDGREPNSHSSRYAGPFNVTTTVTVKAFARCAGLDDSAVATYLITKQWTIGDAMGAPDHAFTTTGDALWFADGGAMRSGAIVNCQTSVLSTVVMGPGQLSFKWRTSCEKDPDDYYEWDHAECLIDGEQVAVLDGIAEWTPVTWTVAGDGAHVVQWLYVKDDIEKDGEDCAWVKDFDWQSDYTATQTTPVSVPYEWIRRYYPDTVDEYDAYEAVPGQSAANGRTVGDCYVAGLDPTNPLSTLTALIEMRDGGPVVTWSPNLNTNGEARVYKVWGKASLDDADVPWSFPTNGTHRFFKVSVEMP